MPVADLSSIPLFASLPADEIHRLEMRLRVSTCPPGRVLFQEGHSDDKFYVLLEGQVEVVKALGRAGRTPAGCTHGREPAGGDEPVQPGWLPYRQRALR